MFPICEIQTSRFTYCRDKEDRSCSRFPVQGKESESETYLPFNLFIFMARGLFQSICLVPVIFMIILSNTYADDRIWIYCSFALMPTSIFMQGIILYIIEYAFTNACGSTFSTAAAINSQNSSMAIELLWLGKQPSKVINERTLVSVATGHNDFPVALVNKILSNGFNPNQRVEDEEILFMFFLKNNHVAAIRHLCDKCDIDVTARTEEMDRRGIMHYGVYCDLQIVKYLIQKLEVPYDTMDYYERNILFGADGATTHHEIQEDTLDYLIDDLQLDYRKKAKYDGNILMKYIKNGLKLRLDRIIYWIEKRKIDPWDCDDESKTLFDHLEERINKNEQVDKEVRQYLFSIKDKKSLILQTPSARKTKFSV